MDQQTRLSLLKDEYVLVQRFYDDVDKRSLTIKGWSVTLTAALVAAGLRTELLLEASYWLLIAAVAFMFWYLEAYYRNLGYFYGVRIRAIEEAFRNGTTESEAPLQLWATWVQQYDVKGVRRTWHYFKKVHTALPHALFILGGAGYAVVRLLGL